MIRISNIKKIDLPAFIFVSYYWSFLFLKLIARKYYTISMFVHVVFVLLLVYIFVINLLINKKLSIEKAGLLFLLFLAIFSFDSLIRSNSYTFSYLYQFVYAGLLPVIFLSKVKDVYKLLYYFAWFSALALIVFGLDPLNNFVIFTDYMDFGFNLALPAFLGLFIGYHFLRIKWMLFLVLIAFLEAVIFSNRSVILTVVSFLLLYFIINYGLKNKNAWYFILPLGSVVAIFSLNFSAVINYFYFLFSDRGYQSNNFIRLKNYIATYDGLAYVGPRLNIWRYANSMISDNPILGHGIGAFENSYGIYAHNIYFEIMVTFGSVGLLVFVVMIFKSFKKMIDSNKTVKILGLLFFSLWFPKLFFSVNFFADIGFWCFISFYFLSLHSNKQNTIG
ncbi:O-antigen ligase family protein [bacterium]|nr:O-antigen ligase family protein [bacterium]